MTELIYYGTPDGDIDRIFLFPSLKDSIVILKDGIQIHLEDITQDGSLYQDGQWLPYFKNGADLQLLHYIYLLLEIIELNKYTFPSRDGSSA